MIKFWVWSALCFLGSTDTAGDVRKAVQVPVQGFLKVLLGLEDGPARVSDKTIAWLPHVFFFGVLGALAAGSRKLLWVALGVAVAAEMVQMLTATRSANWWDLGVNLVAVSAGWWIGRGLNHRGTAGTETENTGG